MTFASPRLIRKRPFISVSSGLKWGSRNRQGRGGRNEQKSGKERTGKNGGRLTDGGGSEHFKTPLHFQSGPDHRARIVINARGVPIWKSLYFSVSSVRGSLNLQQIAPSVGEISHRAFAIRAIRVSGST